MDTYRVISIGVGQWAIERRSENGSFDLLPTTYAAPSEAADALIQITREERRRDQASRLGRN
jgi:hypothetical protein